MVYDWLGRFEKEDGTVTTPSQMDLLNRTT